MTQWLIEHSAIIMMVIAAVAAVVIPLIVALCRHYQWIGQVNADLSANKSAWTKVDEAIGKISERIDSLFHILSRSRLVEGGSPLRLTETGRAVSKSLGASEIAAAMAPGLKARVRGLDPYLLQEACYKHVNEEYVPTAETERLIHEAAYNNGVTKEQVLVVIAIELRDALLPPNADGREDTG